MARPTRFRAVQVQMSARHAIVFAPIATAPFAANFFVPMDLLKPFLFVLAALGSMFSPQDGGYGDALSCRPGGINVQHHHQLGGDYQLLNGDPFNSGAYTSNHGQVPQTQRARGQEKVLHKSRRDKGHFSNEKLCNRDASNTSKNTIPRPSFSPKEVDKKTTPRSPSSPIPEAVNVCPPGDEEYFPANDFFLDDAGHFSSRESSDNDAHRYPTKPDPGIPTALVRAKPVPPAGNGDSIPTGDLETNGHAASGVSEADGSVASRNLETGDSVVIRSLETFFNNEQWSGGCAAILGACGLLFGYVKRIFRHLPDYLNASTLVLALVLAIMVWIH